jgi:tRNA(Ile)-lysidine synthetase-like protein
MAELSLEIHLTRLPVEPWMFRGEERRAALALPLAAGEAVTVRNRRPGDRVRPLGAAGSRRLKEVLIDRHLPRATRDRIPLLCWRGEIAWVAGVTIDHRFRITTEREAWVAELSNGSGPDPVGILPPPARFSF